MTRTSDPGAERLDRTCGNCRFRGEPIEVYGEESDWEMVPTRFFLCGLIQHHKSFEEVPPPPVSAFVKDGSGYYAALCVAEDFGCNKWERSSEKDEPR